MRKTKARIAMEQAKKERRSKYRGTPSFKARRAHREVTKRKVLVGEEKEQAEQVIVEKDEDEKPYTIMRYLGKPIERLKARARELEVIDIAPAERITFGSVKALEAYRRDLYAINGEKTAHFRTQRRGLTLTIWRDG